MWTTLNGEEPNRMRLYLAMHEGEAVAAATMLTVGRHVVLLRSLREPQA